MSLESLPDGHEPEGKEIFLDTSIHCSRLKGSLFTERIDRVLRMFRWVGTSTYTKVEFGNVVLANAEYYLRKLNELGSLDKTLSFIGNVLQHHQHRSKVTWSFNLLLSYGGDEPQRTERAKASLRRLLKLGTSYVERGCDKPLADGTCCSWARKAVHRGPSGQLIWKTPTCKRTAKVCSLDDFFVQHRGVFGRIKEAIDALPDEKRTSQLASFSEVIGKAAVDPGMLLDYKTGCRRLADAIIAVDSYVSNYKNLFSQNEKESGVLCDLLHQVFYYLPPNPERGVLIQPPTS